MIVTDRTIAKIRLRCSGIPAPGLLRSRSADRRSTLIPPANGRSRIAPATWHRIIAEPTPGMTTRDAAKGQPAATQHAVPLERLQGVLGAGREVAAAPSDQRRQQEAVELDRRPYEPDRPAARPRCPSAGGPRRAKAVPRS